nr:MAG TPA: hypothetical protein [Caudoviricetes sp.]
MLSTYVILYAAYIGRCILAYTLQRTRACRTPIFWYIRTTWLQCWERLAQ